MWCRRTIHRHRILQPDQSHQSDLAHQFLLAGPQVRLVLASLVDLGAPHSAHSVFTVASISAI